MYAQLTFQCVCHPADPPTLILDGDQGSVSGQGLPTGVGWVQQGSGAWGLGLARLMCWI